MTKYLEEISPDTRLLQEVGYLSVSVTVYLEDRPIFLFDEWAADRDPVFRDIFYHQLLPDLKQRGKLISAIGHDDRYFHLADRVIKLDYGKVESDKHGYELAS